MSSNENRRKPARCIHDEAWNENMRKLKECMKYIYPQPPAKLLQVDKYDQIFSVQFEDLSTLF